MNATRRCVGSFRQRSVVIRVRRSSNMHVKSSSNWHFGAMAEWIRRRPPEAEVPGSNPGCVSFRVCILYLHVFLLAVFSVNVNNSTPLSCSWLDSQT